MVKKKWILRNVCQQLYVWLRGKFQNVYINFQYVKSIYKYEIIIEAARMCVCVCICMNVAVYGCKLITVNVV